MGKDRPNRKDLRYLDANSTNSDIYRDINKLNSYHIESVKSEPGLIEVNLSEKKSQETKRVLSLEKILRNRYLKTKKIDFDENLEQLASPVGLIKSICRGWDQALMYTPTIFIGKVRGYAVGVPIKNNKSLENTH